MSEDTTVPIPQPDGLPIVGNIANVDKDFPLGSMVSLSDQFGGFPAHKAEYRPRRPYTDHSPGEIYRMRFLGRTVVFVSTQALINETCDEKRFRKSVNKTLMVSIEAVHEH